MRTIELTKIEPRRDRGFSESDDPTENQTPAEVGYPASVNIDAIRCFYRRKDERPGTRITFSDGGGFAVLETYDDVKARIEAANAPANGSRSRAAAH